MRKAVFYIVIFLVSGPLFLAGKSTVGYPFIKNFPTALYQAGVQNWSIQQHENDYLFFANNNGLLQYDGNNWSCFPLKNNTIARSLLVQGDKVFIGGQNEFGYFQPDDKGRMTFHSLLELIPETDRQFEDVWEIIAWKKGILFYTSDRLYYLYDEQIKVIWRGEYLSFLGKAHDRVFLKNQEGLFELKEAQLLPLQSPKGFDQVVVTSVLDLEQGELLFTTLKKGIFKLNRDRLEAWETPIDSFLKQNRIYCATQDMEGQIVLGTSLAGVVILKKTGKLVVHLSKSNGLQKNNVLSVFIDSSNNLWVGLDNGIDFAQTSGTYTQIIPDGGLEGTAYACVLHDGYYYFGTSSGLYALKDNTPQQLFNHTPYQLIDGTQGQVWGLQVFNGQLLLGHHEGAFQIERNGSQHSIKKISTSVAGVWKFLKIAGREDLMIAGTYGGLELYQKRQKDWFFVRKFEALQESSRFLEQDELSNIWVAHPYRGLYKVNFDEDYTKIYVKLYGQKDGLSSDNLNNVFSLNKGVIFTSMTGIYRYNPEKDFFEPYREMENLLEGESQILRFFEDKQDHIWFVGSQSSGLLQMRDKGVSKSFKKHLLPGLTSQLVRGFELIYPIDSPDGLQALAGAEKGFIRLDPFKKTHGREGLKVTLQHVYNISNGDSLLLAGQYSDQQLHASSTFLYQQNAFRFAFTAPNYKFHEKIEFQCYLEGSDHDWSPWSIKREKEYTNLRAGEYTFQVRAKNLTGDISPVVSYSFEITPPWYFSNLAKLIYFLLILLFLATLILVPRSRFRKKTADLVSEQRKKEEEHQKVVAKREQAIIELKNKNLEAEIRHKNQELASTTMHLVQRSEMLGKLKDQLEKLGKDTKEPKTNKQIKSLIKLLSQDADLDREWDQFAHHFDQVHSDFLKRLKINHPQLTSNDQKLCAYLRMNLSTKEIAPLMNISIRGVEVGRYRLRKKLNIDKGVDLNELMMRI